MALRIDSITARPLSVPLLDPFTIASGRIETTRAALVEVTLVDEATGARAVGLGEAAALPPVTHEDQPDLIDAARAFAVEAVGRVFDGEGAHDDAFGVLRSNGSLSPRPVARSAIETAILDAAARLQGRSLFRLLMGLAAGDPRVETGLVSDITIPIHDPPYMGTLAEGWGRLGFSSFKVKVGLDLERDVAGLAHILARVPTATFRIDANGGYSAREAIALYDRAMRLGAVIECFEQPCARDDLEGMATVTGAIAAPVIADESLRAFDDLRRIVDARAASGVNLKLVKLGGPTAAQRIGREARAIGLDVMMGAMVETRLGITSAAHVCVAIGGARFVDLDTAWLMREDPFAGGYIGSGPHYTLPDAPGQAIEYVGA